MSPLAVPALAPALSDRAIAETGESRAQPNAKALDALFGQLKELRDADAAPAIERAIWNAWMQSGRPDVDALMQQAVAAMGIGDYRTALGILDRLVLLAPNYAEGWNKRATVLYLMGDYARSLSDIDKVLALEPRHFGAISGIALIKLAQGDKKAALAAYRRALEIHPFLPGALQTVPALEREVEGNPI